MSATWAGSMRPTKRECDWQSIWPAKTWRRSGGPFGAAVFQCETGRVVGVGVNSVIRLANSVLHAEALALMLAERNLGTFSLAAQDGQHFELFSTCEPCTMCMGSICWSGVPRIVFGATRHDASEIGFDEGPMIADLPRYLAERQVALEEGFLRAECRAVMEQYAASNGVIYNGSTGGSTPPAAP